MAKSKTVAKRIADLSNPDADVRRTAARKLGEFRNDQAVQPLCLALRDDDAHVRRAAASSLGMLHHPDAMQPLQEALKNKNIGLRGASAWSLGQIGKYHPDLAYQVVRSILAAAEKDKPGERHRYISALTAMESIAVSPLCVELCSHRSTASQECAQQTLRNLLYRQNLNVPRHLLADASLSPAQIWDTLEMLEAARPTGFFASRRYPTARVLCEFAAANANEEEAVQQGAMRILEYLSLGRASQYQDPNAGAQLLRMAAPNIQDELGESLLRGVASAVDKGLEVTKVNTLIAGWYNLLRKVRNRFTKH